jgi:site-specific DNA-methyltransferase (adenine-specific)
MIDLRQGNCLELMKEIPDKSIDMILTDLPYGSSSCKWDNVIPFEPLWEQYNRIIKDNGAIVLFGNEPFSSQLRMSNMKMYKYDWKWDKCTHSNPLLAKKQPLRVYEDIMVFYKKQPTYNPQMTQGLPYKKDYNYKEHRNSITNIRMIDKDNETGLRYPVNIIKFPMSRNNQERLHPTQKPVTLLEYLIKTYTNEGETVLDSCAGSGSCGVAAINTNRNFIGIELDEKFFEVAKNRINASNTKLKEEQDEE